MVEFQGLVKDDLSFVFQLLASEDEVKESINTLEEEIRHLDNIKKQLNVAFHQQSHFIRNLIVSLIFASLIVLIFHFSFFISFILILAGLTGYDYYQRQSIKGAMGDIDAKIQMIADRRYHIQNQLDKLVQENAVYTNKIPEEFRDSFSVMMLFKYLYYGQADNLKEAYNKLDAEYKHREQINIQKEQKALLEESTQILYQQLNQQERMSSLQEQQLAAVRDLAMSAREINATMDQTDKRVEGLEERFVPEHKRKR